MQLNKDKIKEMKFSNVEHVHTKSSSGSSSDIRDEIDRLKAQVDLLTRTKLSHDDMYNSDFSTEGIFTFNKEPNIGKETLTETVTAGQNVSKRNLPGFGRKWNRVTSTQDVNFYNWESGDNKGQHQVIAAYDGDVYTSDNFGKDFKGHRKYGNWASCAISKDGQTIFAIEQTGAYIITTDGGECWNEDQLYRNCENDYDWTTCAMSDCGSKIVVGGTYSDNSNPKIYATHDSGSCWESLGHFNCARVRISPDGNIIYAGGYENFDNNGSWERRGMIKQSILDGSYLDITTALDEILEVYDFDFWENSFVIVTETNCHSDNVYFGINGLGDLSSQRIDNDLWYVEMSNNGTTVIVTEVYGDTLISRDTGMTFTKMLEFPIINFDTPMNMYYVPLSSNDGNITVLNSVGFIYTSSDDGLNFSQNSSVYDSAPSQMANWGFYSNNFIKVRGDNGFLSTFANVFTTKNGGHLFKYLQTNGVFQYDGIVSGFISSDISFNGMVMVIAGQGFVIISRDAGVTWKVIRNDYNLYVDVRLSGDASRVILMNDYCEFYRTSDDGKTWEYTYDNDADIWEGNYYGISMEASFDLNTFAYSLRNCNNCKVKVGSFFESPTTIYSDIGNGSIKIRKVPTDDSNFMVSINQNLYQTNHEEGYQLGEPVHTFCGDIISMAFTTNTWMIGNDEGNVYRGVIPDATTLVPYPSREWTNVLSVCENVQDIDGDGDVFWLVTTNGKVYHSCNTGIDWRSNSLINQATGMWSFSSKVSSSSCGKYLLQVSIEDYSTSLSINGGKTWRFIPELFEYYAFAGCVSATGKYMYIATMGNGDGDYSRLMYSRDCGETWDYYSHNNLPDDIFPLSIKCSKNGRYVTVVEGRGVVYHSDNFGAKFSTVNFNAFLTKGDPYFMNMNNNSSFEQRMSTICLLMSDNGRIQRVFSAEGYDFYSENGGKTWKFGGGLGVAVLYGAMSGNGKFLTLSCVSGEFLGEGYGGAYEIAYVGVSALQILSYFGGNSAFGIINSDDGGKTYSLSNGTSRTEDMVYNIGMAGNGQYQLAFGRGNAYSSNDYGANFKKVSTDQLSLLGFVNDVMINDSGTKTRISVFDNGAYESLCVELGSQVFYDVSPIMKETFQVVGDREFGNSYDLYQIDTSDLSDSIHCILPEISKMYPLSTRIVTICDKGGYLADNSLFIDCHETDKIVFVGTAPSTCIEFTTNYVYITLTSNGVDTWYCNANFLIVG